ncbi:YadA-like family protein [Histophilus somni]|uniref:YadA-like family protein n=1 Tax=Histophilus somni TaxID=731 RepID=UPI0024BD674A|nr:YadA-like family protein [Histophilus somni]
MKKLLIGTFAILSMSSLAMADDGPSQDDLAAALAELEAMAQESQEKEKGKEYKIDKNNFKGTKTILIGDGNTITFSSKEEVKKILNEGKTEKDITVEEAEEQTKIFPNQIIGHDSHIKNGDQNILLGNKSNIIKQENDIKTVANVAMGNQITIQGANDSVAMGTGAEIYDAKGGIALGGFSQIRETIDNKDDNKKVTKINGEYKVEFGTNAIEPEHKGKLYTAMALGYASSSHSAGAVALGGFSTAIGNKSLALGRSSIAYKDGSVALGAGSIANRESNKIGKIAINILKGEDATEDDVYTYADVDKEEYKKLNNDLKNLKNELEVLEANKISPEKQQEFNDLKQKIKKLEKEKKEKEEFLAHIKESDAKETLDFLKEDNAKKIQKLNEEITEQENEIKITESQLKDLENSNIDKEKLKEIEQKKEKIAPKYEEIKKETTKLIAWKSTLAAISVGVDGEHTRQITNVAAGSEASDAVNVAQLESTAKFVDNNIPVHYQDKNGNKVIKKLDNKFYKVDETGKLTKDVVEKKDVLVSLKEETQLTNVKSGLGIEPMNDDELRKLADEVKKYELQLSATQEGERKALEAVKSAREQLDDANKKYKDKYEEIFKNQAEKKVADLVKPDSTAELTNVATVTDLKAVARAGVNFKVDDDKVVHKNIGETLTLKGDGSIKVEQSEDGGLEVKLSSQLSTDVIKGLKDLDEHATGDMAANKNYVDSQVGAASRKLQAGIAGALAVAGLPMSATPGKSVFAASAGSYKGQSAVALGYSHTSDSGKIMLRLQGTRSSTGDMGGSVGVGYQW